MLTNTLSLLYNLSVNVCCNHIYIPTSYQQNYFKDPYQVNDYISKGADKEMYCLDNSQTFIPLIWWHVFMGGGGGHFDHV